MSYLDVLLFTSIKTVVPEAVLHFAKIHEYNNSPRIKATTSVSIGTYRDHVYLC